MDIQGVDKLFNLLETLHPRAEKKTRDAATLHAWALVLEPWDYEQVKRAAVARARENRFFPDPAELAAYLPQAGLKQDGGTKGYATPEILEKLRAAYAEIVRRYHAAGLPTAADAKKQGMSYAEWCRLTCGKDLT